MCWNDTREPSRAFGIDSRERENGGRRDGIQTRTNSAALRSIRRASERERQRKKESSPDNAVRKKFAAVCVVPEESASTLKCDSARAENFFVLFPFLSCARSSSR